MRRHVQATEGNRSATIVPTLLLTLGCSALAALVTYGAAPSWWNSRGAVMTEQVVTNNGVVTTNYVPNNYAVVTQGQLKQFTARAVDELNADLTNNGGAGPALSNLVYGWQQDYATNGYATNTANPARPYKPSDYTAINVGQLKYIASLVYGQLANAGYTGLYPSWIQPNSATDNTVANLGQLKEVFDFDLTTAANGVQDLTATAGVNEIDLSWSLPAVNNATSLTVQESTDGGMTWTSVATLGAASTSYSVADSDPTISPIFQVTATNANASAGNNSTATSSSTPPTPPLPPPQYAVIDLGTNLLYPSKITDSGYVLGYGNSTATSPTALGQYQLNYYVGHNGDPPLTLQPHNSSTSRWIATDVAEDGTVVGLENVYSASLHTQGVVDANNYYQDGVQGDIHNLALWASGATQPTLTAPPVVPVGSSTSQPPALLSGYLEYADTSPYSPESFSFLQSRLTGTTPLISSTATAGSPNIWSIQYINSSFSSSNGSALFDGFTNQSELGTNVVFNSSSQDGLSGTAVFPISVNSSNQCLEEQDVYNTTTFPYLTTKYYLGTNQVPITPIGLGHYLSNASQPISSGAVKTYVLGSSSDFTQYYCWDGINTITLPQPSSGSIFPEGVNAATTTITVPGTGTNPPTSQVVPAAQVIGNTSSYGYIWNMIASTNASPSFAAPQKLDTLVPGAGITNAPWSQINAYGINDGGAIVGTATYTQTGTNDPTAAGSHGVMLLPVHISVAASTGSSQSNLMMADVLDDDATTADSGTSTPTKSHGILVLKGAGITMALDRSMLKNPALASSFPLTANQVTWYDRQLKGDGTFTNWTPIGTGPVLNYTTTTSGIFQLEAIITVNGQSENWQYVRKQNDPYGFDSSTPPVFNPIYAAGQPDYFGVVDKQWQIDVRNQAVAQLGKTTWAEAGSIPPIYPNGPTFATADKCNVFVYQMCNAAGDAPVPLTRTYHNYNVPPFALDWFDGPGTSLPTVSSPIPIPGWTSLGQPTNPQPGEVVSRPAYYKGMLFIYDGAIVGGHSGILDYDGAWINAGTDNVNRYPNITPAGNSYNNPEHCSSYTGP